MRHAIIAALALVACGPPADSSFDPPPLDPDTGGPITTTTTGTDSTDTGGTTAEPGPYPCDAWIGCFVDVCLQRCGDDRDCSDACGDDCTAVSNAGWACFDVYCTELVDDCAHDEPGACARLPVCFPDDDTSTGAGTDTTGGSTG